MADKRTISIPFVSGIETKTDPNQLDIGQFVLLKDSVFRGGNQLLKRYGNRSLIGPFASSGYGIALFKDELVTLTNSSLSSYNPSTNNNVFKGSIVPCDLSVSSIIRDRNEQTQVDCAYNVAGNLYLYTYIDSSNGTSYVVVEGNTGQQVLFGWLASNFTKPRAFSIGNYLVIAVVDRSSVPPSMTIFPILITTASLGLPIAISQTVNSITPNYDGVVSGDTLCLSWNGSDNAVHGASLNANLVLQALSAQVSESAAGSICVFADSTKTPKTIWTVYYDNVSSIRYVVQSGANLGNIVAPSAMLSGTTNIVSLTGYALSGLARVYYQTLNNYSYNINTKQVRSDYISQITATDSGISGSSALFIRGLGLASKAAVFNAEPYFIATYGPSNIGSSTANQGFEPTYFLLNGATSGTRAQVVSRFAAGNAAGYSSSSLLTSLNRVAGSQYQFGYLFKDLVASQAPAWNLSGGVYFQVPAAPLYSQLGINSAFVDFYNPTQFSAVDIGSNLNVNGGCLWTYDGQNVTEHNFHLFPEDILATSASSANGLGAGYYSWVACYTWTDNQGNIHRSAPSIPTSMNIGAAAQVQLNIPTLRVTNKKNVSVEIYRNTPSINSTVFTALTVPQSPLISSTALDSIQFTDFVMDANLNGNSLLYTTGGVLEDVGGPAFAHIGKYRNRLMGIAAENRNSLWYSKETLEGTPVEMSDFQTIFANPKLGDLTCGIEMDDKYVLFKSNGIVCLTGQGPTATGSQNDFSEPTVVVSPVGTANPKSLVLIPDGVMFDAGNSGIWILDRNLNTSYIGAPVEGYNQYNVTSATLIPGTTEVRFGLDNNANTVLVYDYFYRRWGVFTGYNVLSATVFGGLYTWLSSGSNAYLSQETPNLYSDNGRPILQGVTTGWLSLAELQGFQRAYRLYFMGQYLSPHVLDVSIGYDFNPGVVQTARIALAATPAYGENPFYGASNTYGGRARLEQFRINLKRQKCQSIQITLQEAMDTSNYILGAGLSLEAIKLVVNPKLGYPKLPASKSVT